MLIGLIVLSALVGTAVEIEDFRDLYNVLHILCNDTGRTIDTSLTYYCLQ